MKASRKNCPINTVNLTYAIRNDDKNSKDYRMIVDRVKMFKTFNEAAEFSKKIMWADANIVGRPIIDLN